MDCRKPNDCNKSVGVLADQYEKTMKPQLAIAYVPWQKWKCVMDGTEGLRKGTIFEELVMPFYGAKAACNMKVDCNGSMEDRPEFVFPNQTFSEAETEYREEDAVTMIPVPCNCNKQQVMYPKNCACGRRYD